MDMAEKVKTAKEVEEILDTIEQRCYFAKSAIERGHTAIYHDTLESIVNSLTRLRQDLHHDKPHSRHRFADKFMSACTDQLTGSVRIDPEYETVEIQGTFDMNQLRRKILW